ncbi:MAG: AMP-binding protein [Bacteroidetes bacterium]|nr:AMP-binding protein [Bacteroidota bacterium]
MVISYKEHTTLQIVEKNDAKYGLNVMMWEKKGDAYEGSTYAEIQKLVHQCAAGLLSLGVQKGDRIALLSEGRNDWVISELGILYTGAINVPLSVKIEELNDLKFRLAHAGCRMIIVSGHQLQKIRTIKRDLTTLEVLIILDEQDRYMSDEIPFIRLLEQGKLFLTISKRVLEERWQSVSEQDPATICYTSGTTADPKGIVLTHRNYTANVEQASALLPIPEYYCSLLILPWDHSFAHTAGIYTLIKNGASMASVQVGKTPFETLKNIPQNIREVRPHFLLSVPALAKNFRKNIEKGIREKGLAVEALFRRALNVAYKYNGNGWDRGKNASLFLKAAYRVYDVLLFRKIREQFGGRLEFFIGGGALLDIELQRFFYAIGIPMYQGYGLTEASPIISANVPARHKLGSSGTPVINMHIKICDEQGNELPRGHQGEIVVRGENVMAGYWRNEKATKEAIRDGWLYTGDLGYIDDDGFLYVLGREKSLLISHDGEKYSPEGIEEAITEHSEYIDQIMLYNNQSPYTVALVVPNREAIQRYLFHHNIDPTTEKGHRLALELLESQIAQFKSGGKYGGEFPERWLPATFSVLGEGFTEQNKFLNSTLKMVRGKIAEFYRDRIEYMFTSEGKNIFNSQNMMIMRRMLE